MRSVSGVITRRIELPKYSLPYWKHASTCLTSVIPSGNDPGEQPLRFMSWYCLCSPLGCFASVHSS